MIDSLMPKLCYSNPPSYNTYPRYRGYLRSASNYSCAYCTISESENPGATFNIEHFRPRALFPELKNKCENLRYACPRCNSYKSDNWIDISNGCIRDCSSCSTKACTENIDRFIDSLNENPSDMMFENDQNLICAYPGSKPADYTINYLRLNRNQLIKLRHVRKFMVDWENDLAIKKGKAEKRIKDIKAAQASFLESVPSNPTGNETSYIGSITVMYEMMVLVSEQALSQIEEEMRRIRHLIELRSGDDSVISN